MVHDTLAVSAKVMGPADCRLALPSTLTIAEFESVMVLALVVVIFQLPFTFTVLSTLMLPLAFKR